MPERFANDVATVLVGTITSGATSLVVASSSGFPSAGNFRIRIDDEIMTVTGVSGTTWTVSRNSETVPGGSGAAAHDDGATVAHVLTAGGLAQAIRDSVEILLDYTAVTDINNGTAVPAVTWTDVGTNQSFTVASASSVVEIAVRGAMILGAGSVVAGSQSQARIVIDSAGTPITKPYGGADYPVAGLYMNPLSGGGPVKVTGLSVGTHTVKTQVFISHAAALYCRAASSPYESYAIQVTEMAG